MRLHPETEAHELSPSHLGAPDDRQLAVAKPAQNADPIWRHARGSQSRQCFASTLQQQLTDLDVSQFGTKCAAPEQVIHIVAAADRRLELIGINEVTVASARDVVLIAHQPAPTDAVDVLGNPGSGALRFCLIIEPILRSGNRRFLPTPGRPPSKACDARADNGYLLISISRDEERPGKVARNDAVQFQPASQFGGHAFRANCARYSRRADACRDHAAGVV